MGYGDKNSNQNSGPGDGWEIDDDLDKVPERKDVPIGRFLCRIAVMEKKPTKDKSKDYFNLAFEVIDCMKTEEEHAIGGKTYDIFNVNQQALWKLKGLISACGFDSTGSRIPNLTDCEVILDTYEEEYNGNHQIKTKRYKNPLQEGWSGIHESRDATTPPKEKGAKKPSAGSASAPATDKGDKSALAGKKLGTPKPKETKDEFGGGDDEIEI